MKKVMILVILFCCFACIPSKIGFAAGDIFSEFYTVQEFLEQYPSENEKMNAFDKIVSAHGVKVVAQQKRPVRIAIVYPGIQASDYWSRSVLSFKKRMDELGIAYEVGEFYTKPSQRGRVQAEQIRKALANDPDYLIFTLNVAKHKNIIEKILTRERPKLILQNITTPLRSWEDRQPFLYVGFDHQIGAKMLADYYLAKKGKTGPYSVLYFSRGYVSMMRGDTFVKHVADNSERTLAGAYYTDGDRLKAKMATLDILKKSPVDFIYACSTDTALGALDAFKESGKVVPINGWGGGSAELDAILRGELDVTVMRNNDDNGVAMAEAIKLDLEGRGDKVPTVYSGKFFLVEKGIGKDKLDKLVQEAFRYSGYGN